MSSDETLERGLGGFGGFGRMGILDNIKVMKGITDCGDQPDPSRSFQIRANPPDPRSNNQTDRDPKTKYDRNHRSKISSQIVLV